MLIILDRSIWPSRHGPGILPNATMSYGEYREAQMRRFIEELGIPAAMFQGSPTFRSVTTGRASSSIPNMSAGSVRRVNRGD